LSRDVGIPETASRRRLGSGAASQHRLIEVVAADAPLLAQLIGRQLAAQDPIADRLVLELQARGDLFDLEVLGLVLGWRRRHRGSSVPRPDATATAPMRPTLAVPNCLVLIGRSGVDGEARRVTVLGAIGP